MVKTWEDKDSGNGVQTKQKHESILITESRSVIHFILNYTN